MPDTFRKAFVVWRHAGLLRTMQRVLQRSVPSWLFDINSQIAIEVDFADHQMPTVSEKWPHRWAGKGDLEILTQSGMPADDVRDFWAQGARAALCAQNGMLVTYTWYLPSGSTVFGWLRVVFDRRMYSTSTFVAPEFRGHGVHSQTRYFAFPELIALGYSGIVALIEQLNRSSLRTGKDEPRRYIGRLSYARFLGLTVCRVNRKWGVGYWNRSHPRELSFDMFDEDTFVFNNKDALSGLDRK